MVLVESGFAAVQVAGNAVGLVVKCELVGFVAYGEASFRDSVRKTPHGGAKIRVVFFPLSCGVEPLHQVDFFRAARFGGHQKPGKVGAEVQNVSLKTVTIGEDEFGDLSSGAHSAEGSGEDALHRERVANIAHETTGKMGTRRVWGSLFEEMFALVRAMSWWKILIAVLCCGGICWGQAQRLEGGTSETGFSGTGKVIVHGGGQALRAALVQEAESLLRGLEGLAKVPEGEPVPVMVQLFQPEGRKPAAITRELQFVAGDGWRLQVNLRLGRGGVFLHKQLRGVLTEMLVAERALRQGGGDFSGQVEVPPWLVDGIGAAIRWKSGVTDRDIYAALSRKGAWLSVEKVLELKDLSGMNPLEREVFRASAGALVMALVSQEGGKESLASYLRSAATHNGEALSLLQQHFPAVNLGREGLEKWWALKLAEMGDKPVTESLTVPETEERLASILVIRVPQDDGAMKSYSLSDWQTFLAEVPEKEARTPPLQIVAGQLTTLSYRCFPTYREVVAGYLQVLGKLAEGTDGADLPQVLSNLQEFRTGENQRFERLQDLVDWYEISTVKRESGAFEDYLQFLSVLEEEQSKESGHIERYLDRVQKLYGE